MTALTSNPLLLVALVIAGLATVVFTIHRIWPSVTVASAAATLKADALKAETAVKAAMPDLEADAMLAGQKFMTWLADTSSETAAIAKAQASIAKKAALKAQAAAALAGPTNPAA